MTPIKNMTALAVVALMAGCSGGGGGAGAGDTHSSTTVQGDAIKGPMAKAKISLYKITATGKQGALLKETTSDDQGHYSVTLNGYNGVVIAIASVVPGLTTMFDEATGLVLTPTASFRLRASFPVESGKTYKVQINPFTDLATATALAKSGGLSATNVEQANAGMAAALTFNPLTEAPAFKAGKPDNRAAVVLAAVSQIALSGKLGCATGDQAAKVACVTSTLSTKGLDSDFRSELQARINLLVDAAGMDQISINDASGTPVTVPAATPLEQAKFFMGVLRSNAKALDAADLSLQAELKKVADDMQGRTAPLVRGNITALNVASLGAQLWNDVIKGSAPFVTGQSFYRNHESLGSCGFYSDTDYKVPATSKTNAKYVACGAATESIRATDTNGQYKPCSAVGEWCDTQWSYRVRLHPDATDPNRFTIYTQTRESKRTAATIGFDSTMQPYPLTYTENRTHYGASFPGNAATLMAQTDSNGQITALNLTGELSPAFSISGPSYSTGLMAQTYYLASAVASVLGDKHKVALSAALTRAGDVYKLALSGSAELIKAGALETRIELATGSYLQSRLDAAGQAAQDGSQEILIKLKGGTAGSTVTGDLKISAFKADASGTSYIPTLIAFNGSVQRNGVAFFEGALTGEALNYANFNDTLPRSTSNVQTLRAGFVGKVNIPSRPILSVKLSATRNDKGSSASSTDTLSGQYVQGLLTINISGVRNAAADVITLESTNGIKLVIDTSQTTYPLTKGGDSIGEYSTLNHRLTYADSSYEQF